jgi:hypothetical protein
MVDEAERSLHDALSVLSQTVKETRIVLGGGCSEMLMSCAIETAARKVHGKKAIAVEAFARALRQIPIILADNAGYDSSDLVTRLRAAHFGGQSDAGLGLFLVLYYNLCHARFANNLHRYEQRLNWIYEGTRGDRKLQTQTTGSSQRQRGCRDDHSVRFPVAVAGFSVYSKLYSQC